MKTKQLFQSLILTAGMLSTQFLQAQISCQASFTFNNANDPTIVFTNTSSGASTPSYSWDFGDGNYSSAANPSHTYSNNGMYVVCLSYGDSLTCWDYFCDTVTIANGAIPTCTVTIGQYPDSTNPNTTWLCAYYSPQCAAVTYSWSTGASSQCISVSATVTTTYSVAATCASSGCSNTAAITVIPCNVQASFTFNNANDPTISFASTSTGLGGAPYYSWDFGDGNWGAGSSASHTYQTNGIYLVCLSVGDSLNPNCWDTYCDSITITNGTIPTCTVTIWQYPDSMNPSTTWLCAYYSPQCATVAYSWSTGASTQCISVSSTSSTTYSVTATCLSTGCSDSDSKLLTAVDELAHHSFNLSNFPNPFNKYTTISYSLETPLRVEINVYNVMGDKVAEVEKADKSAGQYQLIWNTENLPAGIYHLELQSGESKVSRKIVLIK